MTEKTREFVGLDCGTYHAISARKNGDQLDFKKEINAFFTVPIENDFMLNMLKNSGAPIVEIGDEAYVLGENAVDLALSMNKEYQRPMRNGILSVNEKNSFSILAVILRSIIGPLTADETIVYYSVPGDVVGSADSNVAYHTKVIQSILDKYKDGDKIVQAVAINEAQAVAYAELQGNQLSGCVIDFGGGLVNVCYMLFGVPIFKFSIMNSGDWIDEQSSKHCGETIAFMNQQKHNNLDLSREPSSSIERSLVYHYQLMIEHALNQVILGIKAAGTKANPGKPIPIILVGGTASPKFFLEFFQKTLEKMQFPIAISEIKLAKNHLFSVAKGCYAAAAVMHKN